MALEAQPVEYRFCCHNCGESDRDTKISLCVHCKLHSFCQEHAGAPHRCLQPPKGTGTLVDLDTKVQEFRKSGLRPEGKVVWNIVSYGKEDDTEDTTGGTHLKLAQQLEKRIETIKHQHLKSGDICLVVTDPHYTVEKSIAVVLHAVFPAQKSRARPPIKLTPKPYGLAVIATKDKLSVRLSGQVPAHKARFAKVLFKRTTQGAGIKYVKQAVPDSQSDESSDIQESDDSSDTQKEVDLSEIKALFKRTTQGAGIKYVKQTVHDSQSDESSDTQEEVDSFEMVDTSIPKGSSMKIEGTPNWIYGACVICDVKDESVTACQKCDLLMHDGCRTGHNAACRTVIEKAVDEGRCVDVVGITNYLATALVSELGNAKIVHADQREESWRLHTKESWAKEHSAGFGERVLSIFSMMGDSFDDQCLMVVMDGETIEEKKIVILKRPSPSWFEALLQQK